MRQDTPLRRQWALLRTLCSRRLGMSVREMAAETGYSEKTIRRDLETFARAGFPLLSEKKEYGKKIWRVESDWGKPALHFSFDEALALYLGRQFLEPFQGTYFAEAAENAFRKIRSCLGDEPIEYLENIAGRLHFLPGSQSDYAGKGQLIDDLMVAVEERRQAIIVYQSLRATEPVTYPVHPYAVTIHAGALYLIAHSVDHDEVRTFKVDRISAVELTKLPFNMPAGDFHVGEFFAQSFGLYEGENAERVVLRFFGESARRVAEGRWHPSQEISAHGEGGMQLALQVATTPDLVTWILGFGSEVEVMGPRSLREAVRAKLLAAATRYAESPSGRPRRRTTP